ncbi:50S ribosomal protein L34e [Candidatus Woesearchaeota archaeon]|nr:50S ribosomal protein L34e [Candidatus Woesearchaeota archaeon]
MPAGREKSRSMRKVQIRLPSSKTVERRIKRKPKQAKCRNCHRPLPGIPRERPYKMRNLAKTKKRPERMFGGVLCSKCLREEIKNRVRK